MQNPKSCRNFHKELRDRMTDAERKEKSEEICRNLSQSVWYRECNLIYGYYPLGKEVDCLPFLKQAMAEGKRIALPKTGEEGWMEFYEINSFSELKAGRFGVQEPMVSCEMLQNTDGVVLVPGTVFDRYGNRYGYGKGYYDRYFSRFQKLLRFALAYENQMEEQLETKPTDVKMHRIYTEKKIYQF